MMTLALAYAAGLITGMLAVPIIYLAVVHHSLNN